MPSRRTLRLTFKSSDNGIELLSVERVAMTTPAQPGVRPQASRNGGRWFELRASQGDVLAHRLVDPSVLNSVEVHSLEGPPQRVFGDMKGSVFEVLMPDEDNADTVALVGDPIAEPTMAANALGERAIAGHAPTDLATFKLFPNREEENR